VRAAFVQALTELAARDSRILLLTGDLGYLALEPFAEKYPDRFFNVGVAEQNMVGLSTGLAEAGFMPFIYSIVPFAVLRPYEFIRNGPIQHQLPVRIVGVGGGVDYGSNGLSHYGLEDIAVMRAQPGITVIAPADHQQTRTALLACWNRPGPIYFRLEKDDKTVVAGLDGRFELARAQRLRDGKDVLIIAMGGVTSEAAAAAAALEAQGISSSVLVVASVAPAPVDELAEELARFRVAITVEAHYPTGGLGSLVSEIVAERSVPCRVVRCAIQSTLDGRTGSRNYLYEKFGLSSEALVQTVRRELRGVAR
jgi:transketolase